LPADAGGWNALVRTLVLDGAARQLAMHTQFVAAGAGELRLSVDRGNAHLATEQLKSRLAAALSQHTGTAVRLQFDVRDDAATDTVAAREQQQQGEALQQARRAIESDPNVRDLAAVFGAEIVPDSVKPVGPGQSGRTGRDRNH